MVGGGVVGGGLGLHCTPAASVLSQSWIPHPSNLKFKFTYLAHVPEDLFMKNKLHRVVTYHFVILRFWEAQKCKFENNINSS